MKKSNVKKAIMVVVLVLVLLVTVKVNAEDNPIQINTLPGGTTNTAANTTTNTTTNTATNTNSPITTTNKVANTTSSNYTNSGNLPQTGDASDYIIFAVIGVAIIFAVYTFRRVKDYNIK